MKHLLVFLNAFSNGRSGGDVCFIETYKRMKNVRLTIVTSELGKELCDSENLQAEYIITTHEKTFKNPALIYVKRMINSLFIKIPLQIDCIYSTSDALPDTLFPFLYALITDKPWIGNIFHLIPKTRFFSSFTQQISHIMYKLKASVIITDSLLVQDELIKNGFPPTMLTIRYPGIDMKSISSIKAKTNYTAVTLSRIHASKGVEDLCNIWKNVIDTFPDAKLGIIGTGESQYIATLKKRITDMGLNKNISLLGYLDKSKAYALLKGAKLALFPSHEEGFGMALGEALASETPVIAYDLPVYKDTFSRYISTISCFDIKKFARTCIQILKTNPQKKETKALLEQFSWDKAAEIEYHVIQQVTSLQHILS